MSEISSIVKGLVSANQQASLGTSSRLYVNDNENVNPLASKLVIDYITHKNDLLIDFEDFFDSLICKNNNSLSLNGFLESVVYADNGDCKISSTGIRIPLKRMNPIFIHSTGNIVMPCSVDPTDRLKEIACSYQKSLAKAKKATAIYCNENDIVCDFMKRVVEGIKFGVAGYGRYIYSTSKYIPTIMKNRDEFKCKYGTIRVDDKGNTIFSFVNPNDSSKDKRPVLSFSITSNCKNIFLKSYSNDFFSNSDKNLLPDNRKSVFRLLLEGYSIGTSEKNSDLISFRDDHSLLMKMFDIKRNAGKKLQVFYMKAGYFPSSRDGYSIGDVSGLKRHSNRK